MPERSDGLIHVYIAEYSAITTRNTYYASISYTLWPALVIFLTLISISSPAAHGYADIMPGIGAIGSELICIGWYFCVWEQFNNVYYLEAHLKPKVTDLLKDCGETFWDYELQRLPSKGPALVRIIGDWWAAVIVLGTAVTLFIISFQGPSTNNSAWFVFIWCIALLFAIFLMLGVISQTRQRIKFEKALEGATRSKGLKD